VFWDPLGLTKSFCYLFHNLFSPILSIGYKLSAENFRMADNAENLVPKEQYNELWKKYKNLESQASEIEQENLALSRVRKQVGLPESALLTAKVATLQTSARHEAVVNQGSILSVRPGLIVLSIDKNSIVGTVKDASETTSRVQLLTDSSHIIEVSIRRDGTQIDIPAQMLGDGKKGCRIGFIPRDTDVRKGDTVYASPRDGIFDIPIVVGEVSQVLAGDQDPSVWDIRVQPIEDVSALREVVIVIPLIEKR
jgi:rod shape-determining protein MreC